MTFEHEDWDKDCNGGLVPATNIKNCYICIKCGYNSKGIKQSIEMMEGGGESK